MNNNRRTILKGLALSPFLFGTANAKGLDKAINDEPVSSTVNKIELHKKQILIPPLLRNGDKIAIVAPASPSNSGEVSRLVQKMKEFGVECELGNSVKNASRQRNGYLSLNDTERTEEFMHYVNRKDISGIFCARGGYGIMRILDKLDYDQIAANPKLIIGFSDITALLVAIQQKCNFVTFHGPVASSDINQFSLDYLLPMIFNPAYKSEIVYKSDSIKTIVGGEARGRLTGGNLTMINSLLGTPYEIDTRDSILFIEETHEEPYKVDRLLTQLRLAGKFDHCRGIIIGNFDYMNMRMPENTRKSDSSRVSTSSLRVFQDIFSDAKFPILYGFPFGHMKNKITLPLGLFAEISDKKKELKIFYKHQSY